MLLPSGSVGAPGNVISGGERPVSYGESNSGADCRGPAQWEAVQGGGRLEPACRGPIPALPPNSYVTLGQIP